jgi:hypothetical protein
MQLSGAICCSAASQVEAASDGIFRHRHVVLRRVGTTRIISG